MTYDRETHRTATIRALRNRAWFIAAMGVVGLVLYWLEVANARDYGLIVLIGTVLCVLASARMFQLAHRVKHMD